MARTEERKKFKRTPTPTNFLRLSRHCKKFYLESMRQVKINLSNRLYTKNIGALMLTHCQSTSSHDVRQNNLTEFKEFITKRKQHFALLRNYKENLITSTKNLTTHEHFKTESRLPTHKATIRADKRIPRRGEVGLSTHQIERFEKIGYVMSGCRHARMNAIRLRKENQIYTAEEKAALAKLNFEEKLENEQKVLEDIRQLVHLSVHANF
eukprot:gnl/MRDRNA2_/MRDRNA2_84252_c0_seq3.p1 gnl/MRDRNA2_/MRDRNA2_84252_c0~~gnl/MRDRNA2_/MRDRNA2_84252_c0_seq3.p1  ORF type:complete len:210 (+),score=5.65 gnl/MRDRNA2_/MRDRNA2_84252_c0_seq3:306-935(+)